MDTKLLRELGLVEKPVLSAVEQTQNCILLYEQTLKAMGISLPETISQAVDNSQLAYSKTGEMVVQYANPPECY